MLRCDMRDGEQETEAACLHRQKLKDSVENSVLIYTRERALGPLGPLLEIDNGADRP